MARFFRASGAVAAASMAAVCVLCIGVSAASASPTSLTLSIQPNPLTAGGQGVVQATFNNGGAKLTGAAIFLTFSTSVTPISPGTGCHSLAPLFPKTVACLLGVVAPNTSVTKYVQFTVPSTGPVSVKGAAGYLSLGPLGAGLAKGSDSANVVQPGDLSFGVPEGQTAQTGSSDCLGQGDSVSTSYSNSDLYENGSAGTEVMATGVSGLPCAPVSTGIATDNSGAPTLFVQGAQGQQFSLLLTFPDEYLPWPANEDNDPVPEGFDDRAGYMLYEWPNYPDTSVSVVVPACNEDGSIPADGAGYSTDSCVVSVQANDPDEDSDAGTITVNYDGTSGDPGYHGGPTP